MAERGILKFADPEGYAAGFGDVRVNFTIIGAGDFKAQLTHIKLKYLEIYQFCESLPRIAYIALPPEQVFLSFSIHAISPIFNGFALRNGEMVLHSHGERLHQRTCGESKWGLIAVSPLQLASFSETLTGRAIVSPDTARILRPSRTDAVRLRRLFRQACNLANCKKRLLERPEVRRALEQEMLHAVIHCLTANKSDQNAKTSQRHAAILVRFEQALGEPAEEKAALSAMCAQIGVAERTLRTCCREILGVSPTRYRLLQRLNRTRSALQRANPSATRVAEVARNHQFTELGRFAEKYRATFGESPSVTLKRNPVAWSFSRTCIVLPGCFP
jgi:AraC-like DNA-binding protein